MTDFSSSSLHRLSRPERAQRTTTPSIRFDYNGVQQTLTTGGLQEFNETNRVLRVNDGAGIFRISEFGNVFVKRKGSYLVSISGDAKGDMGGGIDDFFVFLSAAPNAEPDDNHDLLTYTRPSGAVVTPFHITGVVNVRKLDDLGGLQNEALFNFGYIAPAVPAGSTSVVMDNFTCEIRFLG
jgi:hypothetical protein